MAIGGPIMGRSSPKVSGGMKTAESRLFLRPDVEKDERHVPDISPKTCLKVANFPLKKMSKR